MHVDKNARTSSVKWDEADVEKVINSIQTLQITSFEPSTCLTSFSSGITATDEVEKGLLNVLTKGKSARVSFFEIVVLAIRLDFMGR